MAREPRETPRLAEITEVSSVDDGGQAALREYRVARAFVGLADTMVGEFDLTEFLHLLADHCVDLLDVDAAGVLLVDQRGGIRMVAASSERAELLEVFAAETDGGPCVECVRTGQAVFSADLVADADRWPRYVAAAEVCGFAATHALPMRLRREVIGVVSLLNTVPESLPPMATQLGQALADVATIGILQQRAVSHGEVLTEQLQTALNSRVIMEQAKGMLAAHSGTLTPEEAFAVLRRHARSHHHRLSDLARAVTEGTADIAAILATHAE